MTFGGQISLIHIKGKSTWHPLRSARRLSDVSAEASPLTAGYSTSRPDRRESGVYILKACDHIVDSTAINRSTQPALPRCEYIASNNQMDGPKLSSYVKFENKFDDARNIMKSDAALYELLKPYLFENLHDVVSHSKSDIWYLD